MGSIKHRFVKAVAAALAAVAFTAALTGTAASTEEQARRPAADHQRPTGFTEAAAAAEDGPVRVIVGLDVAFRPDGQLSAGARSDQRAAIAQAQRHVRDQVGGNGRHVRSYATVPFMALEVDGQGLQMLRASEEVTSVQVDSLARPSLTVSTATVEAVDMWTAGHEGSGRTVAVLDTGVDPTHPFLSGRIVGEACFSDAGGFGSNATTTCPNGQPAQTGAGAGANCDLAVDGCDHGTHVAGIAAGAAGTIPRFGVARAANIMAVQVFSRFARTTDCGSSAPCALSFTSDQIAGLEHVYQLRTTHSIAAVNMSLGGDAFTSACDSSEPGTKAAIDNLLSAGIATVIATGNDGFTNAISSPACISSAIAVGSTTATGSDISSFSNNHPTMTDVLAPGTSITSSVPGGGYSAWNGTSMATPHVAGAFALLRSRWPSTDVASLLAALKATGAPVNDTAASPPYTKPLIKIFAASSALEGCTDDAREDDDIRATATAVAIMTPRSGVICPGDTDYASVVVEAGTRLRASLSGFDPEVGSVLVSIEDVAGATLASSTASVHEAVADVPATGTYFVKVQTLSALGQPYTLSVAPAHPVVVKIRGKGRVIGSGFSCPSTCTKVVDEGDSVVLYPKAPGAWRFKRWAGDCAPKSRKCTALVNGSLEMTAVFKRVR